MDDSLILEAKRQGFVPLEVADFGFRPEKDYGGPVSVGSDDDAPAVEIADAVLNEMRGTPAESS